MLWRKFLCLRIYCILLNEWLRLFLIPTILILKTGVSFCLFLVIRREGIPTWAVFAAGYVGLTMCGTFIINSYVAVTGLRLAEDTVRTLTSTREDYFQKLTAEQRLYFVKLGRAVRIPKFDVGSFMEYSLEVSLMIIDEIIGQLFFFLSL